MAQLRSSGHSWDASQCASASSGVEVAARQASVGAGSDHANPVMVWLTAADLAEVGRTVDCCCSEGNVLLLRLCTLPRFTPFSLHCGHLAQLISGWPLNGHCLITCNHLPVP